MALYRAKAAGKGQVAVYDPGMHARAIDRLHLEEDLRHAVERGEFEVYYQPEIDLRTGTTIGFEALVRWHHPEQGVVGPGLFIPLAEESGLIVPIGMWVLAEACRQAKGWQVENQSEPLLAIAVNLSARQLHHPDLVARVAAVLQDTGLPPASLQLELTESLLIDDLPATRQTLNDLKGLGVRLAVDDFGTGYSSLSYLRRFTVDTIKVDRSFVTTLTHDHEDRTVAIVRAVIALGHDLGMNVLAEGIETADQLRLLQSLGCSQGQGYYFTEPRPSNDLGAFLNSSRTAN
jgi:EAL domain-containing protein (putative c-di-GMP-specific phosphodiesterase class I)